MSKPILTNKVRCHKCKETIESVSRHHFVTCKCGNVSVDGGREYIRRVYANKAGYDELSTYLEAP